jgi:hypothetical protein
MKGWVQDIEGTATRVDAHFDVLFDADVDAHFDRTTSE